MTINNKAIFTQVRYKFVEQKILELYRNFNFKFPMRIQDIIRLIKSIPNCKIMSYQEFATINNCSINDVISICLSYSGCTHYDRNKNRYLILYNESTENNNVHGRILWTLVHELAHIICGHLLIISSPSLKLVSNQIAENGFDKESNPVLNVLEAEADYFVSTFIAPFPLFKVLNVNSVIDVQNTFGLSTQASIYQWENFLKWKRTHYKTSFDSDIVKLYLCK